MTSGDNAVRIRPESKGLSSGSVINRILKRIRVGWQTMVRPVVEIRGVRLRVPRAISPAVRYWLYRGFYEWEESEVVQATLDADDMVLELGTGLGYMAILCARRVGSDRVFTYEANLTLEPLIRANFLLNDVSPVLTIGLVAQGGDRRRFHTHRDFWVSSTVPAPAGTSRVDELPVTPLEREMERIRPSYVIVDIEGGEIDLVPALAKASVRKICVEVHPDRVGIDRTRQFGAALKQFGFVHDPVLSKADVWFLTRET